jgi:putative redox protein
MAAVTAHNDGTFSTTIESGAHTWYADEPVSDGGNDTGPSGMDLLKGALAACVAITVTSYAKRKQWPLEKIEVTVDLERFKGADYPNYTGDSAFIHEIREQVVLHGSKLTDEQRARLLEIAGKCPVRRVLSSPTFFVDDHPLPEQQSRTAQPPE